MSYSSNISKIVAKLKGKVDRIRREAESAIVREVATTLQASNLRRIHNDGKDVSLSPILGGNYSTDPILVGKKSFATKAGANVVFGSKKKRRSQEWRTITKGGNQYRLVLLDGGYKMVRQISGRQTSKVDLSFTGRLSKEFGIQKQGRDYVLGFITQSATDKAKGLTTRNGINIWGVTRKDTELVNKIVSERINRILGA